MNEIESSAAAFRTNLKSARRADPSPPLRSDEGSLYDGWEQSLRRLAAHSIRPYLLVAAVSLGISIFLSKAIHWPIPYVMDEFSYLLAGDTFAHGRLTNPPHPLWIFFETMHQIQQPTYASQYPPGQGLFLALGQVLTGYPLVGVWLSVALACAAITWMLRGWTTPEWAVVGGLMAALHPTMIRWSQCYWGGAVAAIGGALLLGGGRRLLDRPRPRHAFMTGVGTVILANSRPYEGLVLTLVSAAGMAIYYSRHGLPAPPRRLAAIAAPLIAVLAVAGAWMAYYNFRVTGNPLLMPYVLYSRSYEMTPLFAWQAPPPVPKYRHKSLADHARVEEFAFYQQVHSRAGFVRSLGWKSESLFNGAFELFDPRFCQGEDNGIIGAGGPWFGYVLLIPLLALPGALRRNGWMRAAAIMLALFAVALFCDVGLNLHYTGPVAGLLIYFLIGCLQELRQWRWRERPIGVGLSRAAATCFLLSFLYIAWQYSCQTGWPGQVRQELLERVMHAPGKQLILMRFDPHRSFHEEWVYNGADIDGSKVIWARSMGPGQDQKLLDYFKDRRVLVLHEAG